MPEQSETVRPQADGTGLKGKSDDLQTTLPEHGALRLFEGIKTGNEPDRARVKTSSRRGGPPLRKVTDMSTVSVEDRADSELTEEELVSLGFDFDKYRRNNLPIDREFDPETERSEDEPLIVSQQEAMAKCRMLIEAYIEQDDIKSDSAVSTAKLKNLVKKFGESYRFTGHQTEIINATIDVYYDHRQEGIFLRDQYNDDEGGNRALVHQLTGLEIRPDASFEIIAGPWGLEITTDDQTTKELFYRGEKPPTDFCIGAFADQSKVPPYIIRNSQYPDKGALAHERRHIKYALFKSVLDQDDQHRRSESGFDEVDLPPTRKQVENSLRYSRVPAEDRVKDEILAHSENNNFFPSEYFLTMDGNPYDYLRYQREWGEFHADSLYRQASYKVFVDEYRVMVLSAAADFDALGSVGGYTKKEAVALLVDKPLGEWSKTCQRLLTAKGKSFVNPYGEVEITDTGQPISPVQPEVPAERSEIIFDGVITAEDKKPNWFKERAVINSESKTELDKQHLPVVGEPEYESDISKNIQLTLINKALYERTQRDVAPFFRHLPPENALKMYFRILDEQTVEISKTFTESKLSGQALDIAAREVLVELKANLGLAA